VDGKRLFGAVSDKIQKRSIDQDRLGTDRGKVEAKGVFRRMQSGDVSLAGVHFKHLVNNTMLPFINPSTQLGKKMPVFFSTFISKRAIYQDRLGTNVGKALKQRSFFLQSIGPGIRM